MSVESIGMLPMVRVPPCDVKCSVVVPAYNAARTLAQTLASAQRQTLREIEILVIDDGSRDDTASIVADIAARDSRVRLISHVNAGVSTARNAGIVASRADVIAFLDADDLWSVHHLATHLRRLSGNARLDVSFSAARYIDEAGAVVGAAKPQLTDLQPRDFLIGNPTTTTSTWVARRRSFETIGMFDATLSRSEDQAWLVRAALAGLGISGTTGSVVDYRISNTGLASDLDGMRAGFVAMLDLIAAAHPGVIATHRAAALASEDLYLARRALQLGLPAAVAGQYLQQALRGAPRHIIRQPRAIAGVVDRIIRSMLGQHKNRRIELRPQSVKS